MSTTHTVDDLVGQRQQRLDIVKKLKTEGIDPYPSLSSKEATHDEIVSDYGAWDGKETILSGRIVSIRKHGKLIFVDLQDQTGNIQICIKNDEYAPEISEAKLKVLTWDDLALLDIGDFVQVSGKIGKTQANAITLFAKRVNLLTKAIRPLPNTLADKESKFRKRYLDLVLNPKEKERFVRKSKFWKATREYLDRQGFMEVETPVLEHVTGGADARPFVTHHNELDHDFYLRISTELYLKRLIGAGFEKVFTFGPNFRNEGISDEHLQEYYQIEWYQAYANYEDNMRLTQDLFKHIAKSVYGTTKFATRGHSFDLANDWQIIDYVKVIHDTYGVDIFTSPDDEIRNILISKGVELPGKTNRSRLIDNLWKQIRKTISGPAFLVNEPAFMSPLAKSKSDDPRLTERYHVIIAGSELANGYSEINDPQEQLARFLDQQKLRDAGDDEAQMLDIDYVEMLEYGMPPVSGHGHSERFFWFLEDCTGREGTLFPLLKREIDQNTKKIYPFLSLSEKKIFKDLEKPELFYISDDAKKKWPSLHVGFAIIKGVNIAKSDEKLENEKSLLLEKYSELTTEQIGTFTEIQSYRKMYKEMGADWHSRRPSPEALLRRVAQKKPLYQVNTCVDAYNLIVMKYHVSAGAFDLDQMEFPSTLRLGREGDELLLLGDTEASKVKSGEIIYCDGKGPYNLDFNYRDSQRTAVTENTKNILINIDGVHIITRRQVERSLQEVIGMIQKYCGGTLEVAGIVSAS